MKRFDVLLEGYRKDELTEAELEEFLALLEADASPLAAHILEDLQQNAFAGLTDPAQRQRMLARVLEQNRENRKTAVLGLLRRVAAAAILVALAGGAYLWIDHPAKTGIATHLNRQPQNDVAPGGDKAVLTLADGSTIVLDSAHNGQLARQGNTNVIKKDGQLVYNAGGKTEMVYNTVVTPKGGQYHLVLADGSKAWLNSASSLRYPTSFNDDSRIVELTGEGYFEIATNKNSPFIVKTKDMSVKVLGTHFDMMAYPDEDTLHTTLLEGMVELSHGAQVKMLAPGQQALVSPSNPSFTVREADGEKAIAWTTGFFKFNHTDLHTIMREIARWYDIEVIYETTDNSETYGGRISRNLNLSILIQFLEANGIHHFRIEGKKLIVLP